MAVTVRGRRLGAVFVSGSFHCVKTLKVESHVFECLAINKLSDLRAIKLLRLLCKQYNIIR